MRHPLSITLVCLLSSAFQTALAGKATSNGTYTLPANRQTAVAWLDANRPKYYKAANAEILETRGDNQYLVLSKSPIGSSTYIVSETETQEGDATVFTIQFIERVSGRLADMRSVVAIKEQGDQSEVTMSTSIDYRHPLAISRAVKRLTNRSISQTKALMMNNVR